MALNKDIAERIAAAKGSKTGNWIRDGRYLFEIVSLSAAKTFKGVMFIAEMKTVEAVKTSATVEPNAVDSSVSYCVNLDDKLSLGVNNVKTFLSELTGEPPESISAEDICEMAPTDAHGNPAQPQPLAGKRIRDEAFSRPQQGNSAKFFTHHMWEHVK